MTAPIKTLTSAYVVLLDRDGDRRYTYHETEEDVCAFALSLFEQSRVEELNAEHARAAAAASRRGGGGGDGGASVDAIQYTANDVLDYLDLNVAEVQVLVRAPEQSGSFALGASLSTHSVSAAVGAAKAQQRSSVYHAHDVEWLKQAVCQYLVRCLPQDDDDADQ